MPKAHDEPPTILLVEDDPNDEELTIRALRRSHLSNRIVVARDGVAALAHLHGPDRPDQLPHLVLLDLKLPKVDGLEVLRAIREHEDTRLLPVVILTSSVEEQDLLRGYALGANSFVRKPVDFVQFTDSVRQLGLYWLVVNRRPPHPPPRSP